MSHLSIIRNHQIALGHDQFLPGDHTEQVTTSKTISDRTAYWREPVLNLYTAISEIFSKFDASKSQRLRKIKLYSDVVTWPENDLVSFKGETQFTIWAREAYSTSNETGTMSEVSSLKLKLEDRSNFFFHTTSLPEGFIVHVETSNGNRKKLALVIPHGYLGVCLKFSESDVEVDYREPTDEDFDTTRYLNYLTPEGCLLEHYVPFNDNLLRLLQFQFIVATAHIKRTPQLAKSLLQYIVTVTSRCEHTIDLHIQASSLLATILVQEDGSQTTYVPNLNLSACERVLNSRLLAAQMFEKRLDSFTKEGRATKEKASQMLSASDDVIQYNLLGAQAKMRYDTATAAFEKAHKNLQALQEDLTVHGKRFEVGVKDWKTKKVSGAAKDVILGIIKIVADIALIVTGLTPSRAVSTVRSALTVADTFRRTKIILEKVNDFYKKIKPFMENIQEKVKTTTDALALLEVTGELADLVSKGTINVTDAVNEAAEWDSFAVHIKYMFEDLSTESIDGMSDYQKVLEILPILGKAILSAQTLVIKTGDEWARMRSQLKTSELQSSRITYAIDLLEKDTDLLEFMKRAMFDKLLVVRSWVFMDFWSYAGAYMYYSMAKDFPIRMSVTKPASDYQDDAARLQSAINSFKSAIRIQTKRFEITSPVFGENCLEDFRSKKQISFTISHTDPMFQQYCRVRVLKVRFYVDGNITTGNHKLQLSIRTDSHFVDCDVNPPHNPRAFVGEARVILFEYNVHDKTIEMDGIYANAEDYTKTTPFTRWTIEATQPGVEFGKISGLKMEIWCEVTVIHQGR